MHGKLRKLLASITIGVVFAVGGSIALSSPALAEWRAIKAFAKGSTCEAYGMIYINAVVGALWYSCEWDSPGYMLWVFFDEA
jgi:hypothetical protein